MGPATAGNPNQPLQSNHPSTDHLTLPLTSSDLGVRLSYTATVELDASVPPAAGDSGEGGEGGGGALHLGAR